MRTQFVFGCGGCAALMFRGKGAKYGNSKNERTDKEKRNIMFILIQINIAADLFN